MPVEMNVSQGIRSGIAIVNWAGAANTISVDHFSSADGSHNGSAKTFTLGSRQNWSRYLDNDDSTVSLFPELATTPFQGRAETQPPV